MWIRAYNYCGGAKISGFWITRLIPLLRILIRYPRNNKGSCQLQSDRHLIYSNEWFVMGKEGGTGTKTLITIAFASVQEKENSIVARNTKGKFLRPFPASFTSFVLSSIGADFTGSTSITEMSLKTHFSITSREFTDCSSGESRLNFEMFDCEDSFQIAIK